MWRDCAHTDAGVDGEGTDAYSHERGGCNVGRGSGRMGTARNGHHASPRGGDNGCIGTWGVGSGGWTVR